MPLVVNHESIEDEVVHREFEAALSQLKRDAKESVEVTDEVAARLMDHAKEKIIQHTLLKHEVADRLDLEPSYDEVASYLQSMKAHFGGSESFERRFAGVRRSDLEIRRGIELHLKITALMETWMKALRPPAEEELLQFYEACRANLYANAPFESVRSQVEQDYATHRRRSLLRSNIQALRSRAKVVDSVAGFKKGALKADGEPH